MKERKKRGKGDSMKERKKRREKSCLPYPRLFYLHHKILATSYYRSHATSVEIHAMDVCNKRAEKKQT